MIPLDAGWYDVGSQASLEAISEGKPGSKTGVTKPGSKNRGQKNRGQKNRGQKNRGQKNRGQNRGHKTGKTGVKNRGQKTGVRSFIMHNH